MKSIRNLRFFRISALVGSLLAALLVVNLADERKTAKASEQAFEFTRGKCSVQKNEGGPNWNLCEVTVKNRSKKAFYIYGHGANSPFVSMETKNPTSGKWEKRMLGYCGTGAGFHKIKPGASFKAQVSLPSDLADREFIVELTRYTKKNMESAVIERSPAFRMK